jgi:general stress protein YciG
MDELESMQLLIKDKIVLIDREDYEKIEHIVWHINDSGYVVWRGVMNGRKQTIRMHRKTHTIMEKVNNVVPVKLKGVKNIMQKKPRRTPFTDDPKLAAQAGKKGGAAKVPKGFAKNRKLASESGKVGGTISRRGKKVKVQQEDSTEENITLT